MSIKIVPKTIKALSGTDNANLSFDGNLNTGWFPGWSPSSYPAKALVTLDAEYKIDKIRIYDNSGQPTFRVWKTDSTGQIGQKILETQLQLYKSWREFVVDSTTIYLVIEIDGIQGDNVIPEIEFYGTKVGEGGPPPDDDPPPPPPTPITGSLSGEATKINLCGFHWTPLDKLKPFHSIRLFMSSGWLWQPNGLYVEPLYQAAKPPQAPGLDTYFQKCKEQGLEPIPCINQTPEWYRNTGRGDGNNDYPPIKPGLNRQDPNSYKDYADFLWQFTARYGRKVWPDSALRVDTTPRWGGDVSNVKKSGLNLVHFIEVWNEADKWWKKGGSENEIYMEPEELAAMLTICYNRIKEADPTMTVILPGLTGFDWNYFQRLIIKAKALNNGQIPFDILNLHHYSNLGNKLGEWPPTWYNGQGCAPEVDKDFVGVIPFVDFAKKNNLKIYVTEFGWDTSPTPNGQNLSWQYPTPIPGQTSFQTQAQWLTRTYLEYIRLGVDACYMFNANDEPSWENGGLYTSCGLLKSEGQEYLAKPSYIILEYLIKDLNATTYAGDLSTKEVRILAFKGANSTKIVYWSPTDSAKTKSFKIGSLELIAQELINIIEIK